MIFKPRRYQQLIMAHMLSHKRCMVWAGMGMGKTVSTLSALNDYQTYLDPAPALVIAPLRVAQTTWPDEAKKWHHLKDMKVEVIAGTAAQRTKILEREADVFCTNFEQLPWLVKTLGKKWPFKYIVVDEATRLKGFRIHSGGKQAKALSEVAFLSSHFIELTGTPTANGLIDLWGQAWFIDKGERLGRTMSAYQQAYFYPVKTGGEAYMVKWLPREGSDAKIKAKLADKTVVVKPEDWFDIDQPIVSEVPVVLPDEARSLYQQMEREFYIAIEDEEIEATNPAARLGKCLQIASGAIYSDEIDSMYSDDACDGRHYLTLHDAKLAALKSIVEEAGGAPILVAYQFKHEAKRILESFKGAKLLDRNPQTIRDWNAGKIPMLLAHPASCGHGLNLQDGGNILVFFSCGYNYEQYAQMCERIGPTRQMQAGHPRSVFIYRIVAEKTLDMAVLNALREKKDVLDFILDTRTKP